MKNKRHRNGISYLCESFKIKVGIAFVKTMNISNSNGQGIHTGFTYKPDCFVHLGKHFFAGSMRNGSLLANSFTADIADFCLDAYINGACNLNNFFCQSNIFLKAVMASVKHN